LRFSQWESEYVRILHELGLSRESDEESAALLFELLSGRTLHQERPEELVRGRSVLVVGAGPGHLPMVVPKEDWLVIAADGATTTCLSSELVPALIVTDLDGNMPDEIRANKEGSFVLVHAHGDNMSALRKWVPRFPGEIGGSVAAAPRDGLVNFGGFTDGDRAVFLAEACGAKRVVLARFDFHHIAIDEGKLKLKKLAIAERLIGQVAKRGKVRVEVLSDSGISPWSL
jgi:hypothetical protein